MDKDRDPKLNVRVSQSKKDEWLDAVDENETLTDLVTDAVDKQISDEFIHIEKVEEAFDRVRGDGAGFDISEVIDRLDNLQGTVESLHRELDAFASGGSSYDQNRVSSVAMDLLDHIPMWTDGTSRTPDVEGNNETKLQLVEEGLEADYHNDRPLRLDGSPTRLAEKVGESPALVRQGLIYLEQRTTADIESVVVGGKRHWVQL